MIVIDASLAFEFLVRTPLGVKYADRLLTDDVHAPHLIDIEFASTLRRLTLAKQLNPRIAAEALHALRDWPLERYAHTELLERIWELQHSLSAYDACYVALAEFLGSPLLTCDAKLSRSHGHHARIELAA